MILQGFKRNKFSFSDCPKVLPVNTRRQKTNKIHKSMLNVYIELCKKKKTYILIISHKSIRANEQQSYTNIDVHIYRTYLILINNFA